MAYSVNLLIPLTSHAEIARQLVEMMEQEGYGWMQKAVLFREFGNDETRFFLLSKNGQVILLCRGDRKQAETIQARLATSVGSLAIWQEGAYWGIDSCSQLKDLNRFDNRKAGHFINSLRESELGWLSDAVQKFPEAGKWPKLRTCLKLGTSFTDRARGEFCHRLGLSFGALTYVDIEDAWDGSADRRQLDDWTIQLMAFKGKPEMKTVPRGDSSVCTAIEIAPSEIRKSSIGMKALKICLGVLLVVLIIPFILVLIPLILLGSIFLTTNFARRIFRGNGQILRDHFCEAIADRFSNPITLLPGKVHNHTHSCIVTLPPGIEALGNLDCLKHGYPWNPVFNFKIEKLHIHCTAHKTDPDLQFPEKFREEIIRNQFQIGPHPATRTYYRHSLESSVWHTYEWIIQTPQAVYEFELQQNKPLPENVIGLIDEMVRSFEITGDQLTA